MKYLSRTDAAIIRAHRSNLKAMRRILMEQPRRKSSLSAGARHPRAELSSIDPEIERPQLDLLALNEQAVFGDFQGSFVIPLRVLRASVVNCLRETVSGGIFNDAGSNLTVTYNTFAGYQGPGGLSPWERRLGGILVRWLKVVSGNRLQVRRSWTRSFTEHSRLGDNR